ncbi:MAG TPA: SRPBCC domain-containing protein [Bacteroidota bacterium]|nr:SRPBCC domain-containing protein [Bacteroidota bacterium]
MPDILHRVGIKSPAAKVFKALSTVQGLQHWWTTRTSGDAGAGGMIDFGFCTMKVAVFRANKFILWKCIDGPKDWIGTEVSYRLVRKDGQTFILFKHAKWKRPVEFMHHCSTKWAVFLLSLRDWIERGEGRPAPYDLKIHFND